MNDLINCSLYGGVCSLYGGYMWFIIKDWYNVNFKYKESISDMYLISLFNYGSILGAYIGYITIPYVKKLKI